MEIRTRPYVGRTGTGFTRIVLLLAAALTSVVALVELGAAVVSKGATLTVTLAEEAREPALEGLPAGSRVDSLAETLQLSVDTLPLVLRLFAVTGPVLLLLSVAAGAWFLAGLVRSIRGGQAFDQRNPARLASVAAAVLVGGVLAPLVRDLAGIAVLDHSGLVHPASPFAVAATVDFLPILGAVLLLTVAEAFRRGGALEAEVEGMV